MASFVRIALAGAGSFAKMEIRAGDDISDLAKRACAEFPSWKADSAQLSLYLVAAGGKDEPTEEAISAVLSSGRLGVGWSLEDAGIFSGAWLLAHTIHVAHSALQATRYWLTAVVLRVGSSLFSASSGMENVGVSSYRWATTHESRVLDGRQEHDSNVGGHLPRRMLNFGVDSGENVVGTLKEE
jgi:hypothetical protein